MYKIEQGQFFKESRHGVKYKVVFVNRDVVLLQYGAEKNNHRLEGREFFEASVNEGYFEPQQTISEIDKLEVSESDEEDVEEIPYEEISWVGEKGADSLRSAGFHSASDIERVSDDRLLQCNSVGETAVENIREWVENNE